MSADIGAIANVQMFQRASSIPQHLNAMIGDAGTVDQRQLFKRATFDECDKGLIGDVGVVCDAQRP